MLYPEGAPNCVQEYSAASVLRRVVSERYKPKTVRRDGSLQRWQATHHERRPS